MSIYSGRTKRVVQLALQRAKEMEAMEFENEPLPKEADVACNESPIVADVLNGVLLLNNDDESVRDLLASDKPSVDFFLTTGKCGDERLAYDNPYPQNSTLESCPNGVCNEGVIVVDGIVADEELIINDEPVYTLLNNVEVFDYLTNKEPQEPESTGNEVLESFHNPPYGPITNENLELPEVVERDEDDPKNDPSYEPVDDESTDGESMDEVLAEPLGDVTFEPTTDEILAVPLEDIMDESVSGLPRRSRKRVRHPQSWKCNIRKKGRQTGKEYTTKKGKVMPAKLLKPPCQNSCKKKCTQHITEDSRLAIFENFWSEGSSENNFKWQFVASNVHSVDVGRRKTNQSNFRRKSTLQYFFQINEKKIQVCKTFFLNSLCISDTFVKTALSKTLIGGLVSPDYRGKHVPPNKIPEEVREGVRSHIKSFPAFESHYSRERSSRVYLGCHLSISKMYLLYLEECKKENKNEKDIAKEWLYSDIFNSEFNMGFKEPANDTCDDCDEYVNKLKDQSLDEDKRNKIQEAYENHLQEAKMRYQQKKEDKLRAKKPGSKEKIIMFDLQKCLPTPLLTNASTFYLRKLWTYNLTILDVNEGRSYCAMWDETVADRGPQEMSSCLLMWALENILGSDIEVLTIWTDNCGGQNRNFPMVVSYFWILKCITNLKTINHKFLLKGHTHMEVDGVHSVIERARKKIDGDDITIALPWDWQQFVKQCRFKELIRVYNMQCNEFKNFTSLFKGPSSPLVKRSDNSVNNRFLISQVVHFKVTGDNLGSMFYKTSFDSDFFTIDFKRKTRGAKWPEELPLVRETVKPIAPEKFKDLQTQLKWIPPCFHGFYQNIPQLKKPQTPRQAKEHDDIDDLL